MSFKTKNRKKLVADTRVTLHAKHESKVNYFQDKKKDLETKKRDLNILEKRFADKFQNKEIDECDIDKKMELLDDINKLKKIILNIESNREEIDYLLDTGNILFNYADNSVNNTPVKKTTVNNFRKKIAEKSVMEYFNNNSKVKKEPEKQEQEQDKLDNESTYKSKAKMYEDYLLLTDENFDNLNIEKTKTVDFCEVCNIEKTLYMSEGKMICSGCGDETFILIDSDKPSYKEPPREISYFAYKRINHFNEWLAQFQAKESTDIPQDVYNQIISELKKERIEDMKTLTPHKLREILKKLKKNKYYEHVPHIINRLNGEPPPTISRETEEELRRMFKEIQIPFHKFCPKSRKNFLSYSYVLHKFVQLLELDEFTECFILLKSREKLHQQDQIWKEICNYLLWQYIPSV
tara:strand:- start:376 stop:1596 length:1221 start_codon:yes stop_codon:yes gene_type:complete